MPDYKIFFATLLTGLHLAQRQFRDMEYNIYFVWIFGVEVDDETTDAAYPWTTRRVKIPKNERLQKNSTIYREKEKRIKKPPEADRRERLWAGKLKFKITVRSTPYCCV